MIIYDDVKSMSTEEYFNNNQFSIDAFNKKYALYEGETYVNALKRVCDFVASVENTEEEKKYWSMRWFDEIFNDYWHPAGSIMQGAGSNKKISLANCTTISLGSIDSENEWDNLESIFKNTAYTVAKSAAYRQGLGVDFSKIRPRGMMVNNSSKESSGAVHWMKLIDSLGYYIGQKGRIPAMLFSLNISHPDIEEFITIKSDYTQIQNANISVQITNDFYKAVENNEDWELKFIVPEIKKGSKIYLDVHSIDLDTYEEIINIYGKQIKKYYKIATNDQQQQIITKKINARKLLKLIADNMLNHAEPGIQNIDIAREYSNSDAIYNPFDEYDSRIISTNACSEQYLSRESLCVLSSINMEKFSTNPDEYKKELEKIAESINRFLDNVNECELRYNTYATPHQKMAIKKLRRTGAGITNIGGWLFKLNLEYGSKESIKAIENFIDTYNYFLYKSTIKLGKERGNFELFDKQKILSSKFIQNLLKKHPDLELDYMRNVTVSSIAPTGTLSLMFRNMVMSYGIEPAFGMYYWKRTRISGKYEYYFIVPYIVRKVFEEHGIDLKMKSDTIKDTWDGKYGKEIVKIIEENKDKINIKFKNATEINVFDKLNLMAAINKYIDSSISVTYMFPENTDSNIVYDFILKAYKLKLKSIAAFQDKKIYGIVSYISFKDLAIKLINENILIHNQNFSDEELKELNLSKEYIQFSSAPKRPKILEADIYILNVKGDKYIVAIGLLNKAPYEIFCGKINNLDLKFSHKKGNIEKIKKGQYALIIENEIAINDFSNFFTPVETELFRMVSMAMRHGVSIKFIVEQLSKSSPDLGSLKSAAVKVLKKYIKHGESVSGVLCPVCQSELIYDNSGCIKCVKCDWSKCY